MTGPFWNRKVLLLVGAVLACATVAVSIGLAFPTPVENPALGANWQCHKTAIVTTCSPISRAEPMMHHPRTLVSDKHRV
jgi:hypothetical protein